MKIHWQTVRFLFENPSKNYDVQISNNEDLDSAIESSYDRNENWHDIKLTSIIENSRHLLIQALGDAHTGEVEEYSIVYKYGGQHWYSDHNLKDKQIIN